MEPALQAARTLLYAAAVKVTDGAPDKTTARELLRQ